MHVHPPWPQQRRVNVVHVVRREHVDALLSASRPQTLGEVEETGERHLTAVVVSVDDAAAVVRIERLIVRGGRGGVASLVLSHGGKATAVVAPRDHLRREEVWRRSGEQSRQRAPASSDEAWRCLRGGRSQAGRRRLVPWGFFFFFVCATLAPCHPKKMLKLTENRSKLSKTTTGCDLSGIVKFRVQIIRFWKLG